MKQFKNKKFNNLMEIINYRIILSYKLDALSFAIEKSNYEESKLNKSRMIEEERLEKEIDDLNKFCQEIEF